MKNTINGFKQEGLIEFGIDSSDVFILRYVIDFIESGKMYEKEIEGKIYYWFKYEAIVNMLPFLNFKKAAVYRRLKKLTDCQILDHATVKQGGVYSYYKIGKNYSKLIPNKVEKEMEICIEEGEIVI